MLIEHAIFAHPSIGELRSITTVGNDLLLTCHTTAQADALLDLADELSAAFVEQFRWVWISVKGRSKYDFPTVPIVCTRSFLKPKKNRRNKKRTD